MAVTPNFGIPLYTGTDTAKLDTLLNGQSIAIDTGLAAALYGTQWFQVGTIAQRDALVPPVRKTEFVWKDSVSKLTFRYDGSNWVNTVDVINIARVANITTGGQSIGSTATDLTGMSISFTLPSASIVRFNIQTSTYSGGAGDVFSLTLTNGTISTSATRATNSSSSQVNSGHINTWAPELSVPAGGHTFKVQLARVIGGSNVTTAPSANNPHLFSADRIG